MRGERSRWRQNTSGSSTRRCATASRRPGSRSGRPRSSSWPVSSTRSAWTSSRPASRLPRRPTRRRCAASPRRSAARSSRAWRAAIAPTSRRRPWAIKPAAQGRIHTFIATSDLHLQAKLRMTREQCLEAAVDAVRYARQHTVRRAVLGRRRHAQRHRLPVPRRRGGDQGGRDHDQPARHGRLRDARRDARLLHDDPRRACRTPTRSIFSTHCHDDLGLAVANSLAAVQGGARQVECTVNGIGERAGNAALEEIVMAFHVRQRSPAVHDQRRHAASSIRRASC